MSMARAQPEGEDTPDLPTELEIVDTFTRLIFGDEDYTGAELATVARKVTVVGPDSEALQTPLGQKLSRSANVKILPEYTVTKVMGNGFCSHLQVAGPNGESQVLEADGTFIELGLTPVSAMAAEQRKTALA